MRRRVSYNRKVLRQLVKLCRDVDAWEWIRPRGPKRLTRDCLGSKHPDKVPEFKKRVRTVGTRTRVCVGGGQEVAGGGGAALPVLKRSRKWVEGGSYQRRLARRRQARMAAEAMIALAQAAPAPPPAPPRNPPRLGCHRHISVESRQFGSTTVVKWHGSARSHWSFEIDTARLNFQGFKPPCEACRGLRFGASAESVRTVNGDWWGS